jgi:hypothetical protein
VTAACIPPCPGRSWLAGEPVRRVVPGDRRSVWRGRPVELCRGDDQRGTKHPPGQAAAAGTTRTGDACRSLTTCVAPADRGDSPRPSRLPPLCTRPSRTAVSVSSLVSAARGWRTCCSKSTQFLCRAGLEHPPGRRAEGLLGRAERTGGSTLEACPFQADHRDGRPPGSRSTTSADVRHGKCRNVAGTAAVLARGRSLPGTPVSDLRTADSGGGTLSVQRALARRWRE